MAKRMGLQLLSPCLLLLSTAARGGDRAVSHSAAASRAPAGSIQRIRPGEALDPGIQRGEVQVRGKRCRGGVEEGALHQGRARCVLRLRGAGDAPMQDIDAPMLNPAARIYAIGGQTDGELHVSTVESLGLLDAASGQWRVEPPMPRARTGCCAAVLGGRLFVLGGHDNRYTEMDKGLLEKASRNETFEDEDGVFPCLSSVDSYAPPDGPASALSGSETLGPGSGSLGSGSGGGGGPAAGWQSHPELNFARSAFAAAVASNRIFAFGGTDGRYGIVATTESFAPGEVKWRREAALPRPRAALSAAAVGDSIFLAGGTDGQGEFSDAFDIFHAPSGTFQAGPPLLSPRSGAAAVVQGGRILLIGGVSESQFLSVLEYFDLATSKWNRDFTDGLGSPRTCLAAVSYGPRVYAVGGLDPAVGLLRTAEMLDEADGWSALPDMPTPRVQLAAAVL